MRLSEEIRKIADGCISEGISCSFPNYMGFDCGKTEGLECSDCIAMSLMVLADKVEMLESGWSEDRVISEWVRERGGIEIVKEQCKFSDDAASWIRRLAEYEDDEVVDIDAAMCGIERRLMPRGMEWPKVDGKPVDFTTGYTPSLGVLEAVEIYNNGACTVMSHDGIVANVADIHIAKPDPIGADGLPVKKGETVYHFRSGEKFNVISGAGNIGVYIGKNGKQMGYCRADYLTHTKPEPADSWERLEKDAEGIERDCGGTWHKPDGSSVNVVDLVRRAKALAENED